MTHGLKRFRAINITVSFLFFAFLVVGFIFICTDTEYKLNQQMARGYISSDAIFFDFENPAIKPYGYGEDIEVFDSEKGYTKLPQNEYDPDFVLRNKVLEDGVTSVEKLLASSDSVYFTALHKDTMRAAFYKGKPQLPPMISGRFFTEDECLSDTCYAVVGRNNEKNIYEEDNKRFFDYSGRKYEVVGITGIASQSALDSVVFVNIGSLSPEEQLEGMYYIDCSKDNGGVYADFAGNAKSLFGCNIKTRKTPMAFIDIASGEMYMKNYLFVILVGLMVFAYINTLVQFIERQLLKISIMKLCGSGSGRILKETGRSYIIDCMIGIATGCIVLMVMLCNGVFALEYSYILNVILGLSCASLGFAILGFFVYAAAVIKTIPQEVIRKV